MRAEKCAVRSEGGGITRVILVVVLACVPMVLWQCGGDSNEIVPSLEIRVKDHRDAIDDFKELLLTIDALRLSTNANLKSSDTGWIELEPRVKQFDLTRYKDGDSLLIYEGGFKPQQFEAIDLRVGETKGVLEKGGAPAPVENNVRPIRLQFTTKPARPVVVVLDLEVLDLSDHAGQGYDLRVRGYELFASGKLLEKVPPG